MLHPLDRRGEGFLNSQEKRFPVAHPSAALTHFHIRHMNIVHGPNNTPWPDERDGTSLFQLQIAQESSSRRCSY